MKITVLTVGKVKEPYLKDGISEYTKRLSKYTKLEIIEVRDENIASRSIVEVKAKEGKRLLEQLVPTSYTIALERSGKTLTSKELANKIGLLSTEGFKALVFIIGGTLGLSQKVIESANFKLSLSSLTFPHQLTRLLLLEQIYRAFKILRGEPYHR